MFDMNIHHINTIYEIKHIRSPLNHLISPLKDMHIKFFYININ